MHIEIDTERMSLADALALRALIYEQFPGIVEVAPAGFLSAAPVIREADAEEAFAGGPGAVIPSAEEAFAPLADGASVAISPSTIDGSGPLADTSIAPPAPTGTTVSPQTPTASLSSVELDSTGIPWDARIHAGTKSKVSGGAWKKKKGVDDATVAAVTAELKTALAAGGPAPLAPAPTASTGTLSPVETAPAAAIAPPAPVAPAAPAAPAPPAPAPVTSTTPPDASAATTVLTPESIAAAQAAALAASSAPSSAALFGAFMTSVTKAQTAGKLQAADLTTIAQGLGLESIRNLLIRPDLIPQASALLEGMIASYA